MLFLQWLQSAGPMKTKNLDLQGIDSVRSLIRFIGKEFLGPSGVSQRLRPKDYSFADPQCVYEFLL